ncbi:hypothetical protein RKD27_001345 [Streptomyces sp. SAI-126]|uniref:hypothetical protein n=1 Tax=Streptomyces sp. SAI-126 TaxID=3377732 RepID=UPI003C7C7DDE
MSIARLNAFDGLFLRAEHLERMQEYTRSLAHALGRSGGPGVVHGYTTRLSGDGLTLTVDPGLAVGPTGRPFLLDASVALDLRDPEVIGPEDEPGTLRMITVTARETLDGKENVYGDLCADASMGSKEACIREEAVIGIGALPLALPPDKSDRTLRSRASSLWFRQEHRQGGPWIAAVDAPDRTDVLRGDWGEGLSLPMPVAADAVPLGVLLRTSGRWVLDVWTVRRERMDSPALRARQAQLGLRSWDVFLAQVLQFQAMLAAGWAEAVAIGKGEAGGVDVRDKLEAALRTISSPSAIANLQAALEWVPDATTAEAAQAGTPTLVGGLGIVELPPAGFLPCGRGARRAVREEISAMFPQSVELTFRSCPADAVLSAVESARNLRRVPLDRSDDKDRVGVEILVPDGVDGPDGPATGRPWVAFRRRAERTTADLESVDLYLLTAFGDDVATLVAGLTKDGLDPAGVDGVRHHVLHYPVDGWALPPEQPVVESWRKDDEPVTAVALARSADRRVLTGGRAALLLDLFQRHPDDEAERGGGIYATVRTALSKDAVVLVRRRGMEEPDVTG